MPGLLSLSRLIPDGFHVGSAEALATGIVVRVRADRRLLPVTHAAAIPVRFTAVTYDKRPIFPWPTNLSRTQCCNTVFHVTVSL